MSNVVLLRHVRAQQLLLRVVGVLAGHIATIGLPALTGRLRIRRRVVAVARGKIGSPPLGSGVVGGK